MQVLKGKKKTHKIYKNKRVISFSIFLKDLFRFQHKNPCNELCKSMTKSLEYEHVACYIRGPKNSIRHFIA